VSSGRTYLARRNTKCQPWFGGRCAPRQLQDEWTCYVASAHRQDQGHVHNRVEHRREWVSRGAVTSLGFECPSKTSHMKVTGQESNSKIFVQSANWTSPRRRTRSDPVGISRIFPPFKDGLTSPFKTGLAVLVSHNSFRDFRPSLHSNTCFCPQHENPINGGSWRYRHTGPAPAPTCGP